MRVRGQPHAPAPQPPGKTWHPLYRRLGGPQGWSGCTENPVPTGIRSWTIQPIVSSYTNWATRPTLLVVHSAYLQHSKCVHLYMWPIVTAASILLLFSLYHMLEVVSLLLTSCNLPQYFPSSSISSYFNINSTTLLNFAICFNRIDLCG